jgi:hypothetical protein
MAGGFASSDGWAAIECELADVVSDWLLDLLSAAPAHAAKNNKNNAPRKTTPINSPVFLELPATERNLQAKFQSSRADTRGRVRIC